jgi:hypothetical protein
MQITLKEWLRKNRISIYAFSKITGICQHSLASYVNGKVPRINIAYKIYQETGKQVSLESLGTDEKTLKKYRKELAKRENYLKPRKK